VTDFNPPRAASPMLFGRRREWEVLVGLLVAVRAFYVGETGDAAGALAAYRALLADRIRVLGTDHSHTLTNRHQVAYYLGEVGDGAGALAAFREVLADRIRALGTEHSDTQTTRSMVEYWSKTNTGPCAEISKRGEGKPGWLVAPGGVAGQGEVADRIGTALLRYRQAVLVESLPQARIDVAEADETAALLGTVLQQFQ